MKIILTIKFSFLLNLVFGQIITNAETYQFSGQIIWKFDGKPISFAQIKLNKSKGVLTDSLGKFKISGLKNGVFKVDFSAIGHEDKDTLIEIKDGNMDDFFWQIQTTNCGEINRNKALIDIKTKNIKLYLQGGESPIRYTNDGIFQKKYKLNFHDFGCIIREYNDCIFSYNQAIFEYLDSSFGLKWRKKIRNDVLGFSK